MSVPVAEFPQRLIGVARREGDKVIVKSNLFRIVLELEPDIKYRVETKDGEILVEGVVESAGEFT